MSILLVDDAPEVTSTLELNLKGEGWTILTADSGAAALRLLNQENDIEVLASDFNMPGMDGAQLINRAQAIKPELYTIVFTGFEEREYAIRSLRVGADDFIEKDQELRYNLAQAIRRGIQEAAIERMGRQLLELDSERQLVDLVLSTLRGFGEGEFDGVCVAARQSETGSCSVQRAVDLRAGSELDSGALLSEDSAYRYVIETGKTAFPPVFGQEHLKPYFTDSQSILVVAVGGSRALGVEHHELGKFKIYTWRSLQLIARWLSLAMDRISNLERWLSYERKSAEYEQGLLARALLHGIINPLNNIAVIAQSGEVLDARDLMELTANVGRIKGALDSVLRNRVKSEGEPQPISIKDALEEAISRFRVYNSRSGVEIECESSPALPPISGNREMFVTAFVNLLQNGAEATEHRGRLSIHADFVPLRQQVELGFSDDGRGISLEEQRRIFDYGYTTGSKEHFGQGLALTQEVVQRYGGEITVTSREGAGTTFRVVFPVRSPQRASAVDTSRGEA